MPDDADNPSPELERLTARRDELSKLQEAMAAKMKSRSNDYGIRTWWCFVIVGLLTGWLRARGVLAILQHGIVFWIAGLFFCIFALDSAEVHSKVAIFLYRIGEKRISGWLYQRALTIR